MKYRLPIIFPVLLSLIMVFPFVGNTQVFSTSFEKKSAAENIHLLHKGSLIVPLMNHSSKIALMKKMIEDSEVDKANKAKMKKELEEVLLHQETFNQALIEQFTKRFDFCEVMFIPNDQLKNFDPSRVTFINPETLEDDENIVLKDNNYFILKYYKSSGVASHPEEVRAFRIADASFEVLQHPFPSSPDRQTSFRLRFRDLLNLSLNTNEIIEILVIKLNESLHRYLIG